MRRIIQMMSAGDAVACFNPAYGQGMTAAALQVAVLQKCLKVLPKPLNLHHSLLDQDKNMSFFILLKINRCLTLTFTLWA